MPTIKKREDGVNGCVYFFRIAETDTVFMGASTTNSPRMRYGQLSRLFPYKLELVGWIRTGTFLALHSKLEAGLSDEHILNGWYDLPPARLASIFSSQSEVSYPEVLDMVLKGTTIAIDGGDVVAEAEKGSVEKFLEVKRYVPSSTTCRAIPFRDSYRNYVMSCEEPISLGDFRRAVSASGFKRTYDNNGFFVKKGDVCE